MRWIGRSARGAGARRLTGGATLRLLIAIALVATATALAAAPAQAAGPAATISLSLSSSLIPANGLSTTTATVTVLDSSGTGVPGETIGLVSSDPFQVIGTVTDNLDGTYTATITSSTIPGPRTITATDAAAVLSAQQTLTQFGPAHTVVVSLLPSSIPANGQSTSIAKASVTDAIGDPVPGDFVTFSSSPSGVGFSPNPATDNGDGTYTTVLTSSTFVGTVTVTADDASAKVFGKASLIQNTPPTPSQTTLTPVPSTAVTDQPVTLLANVSSGGSTSGTITFTRGGVPISGCANVVVVGGGARCAASFAASSSPQALMAVFVPSSPTVGSSSGSATVNVGPASTSTSLFPSASAIRFGSSVIYTATVAANAPGNQGPLSPSGTVTFLDRGQPMGSCVNRPLFISGGVPTATCAVAYRSIRTHAVRATYRGDSNFARSSSGIASVSVQTLGTLRSSMYWTFGFSPAYTKIISLGVHGAPVGGKVLVLCHRRGCPFAKRTITVKNPRRCGKKGRPKCTARRTVDLTSLFARHHLAIKTYVVVEITRTGWNGKYYKFVVRAGKGPSSSIGCLPPGAGRPGGC